MTYAGFKLAKCLNCKFSLNSERWGINCPSSPLVQHDKFVRHELD